MAHRGRLVVIEGPSGAGKTTVARRAAELLHGSYLAEAFDRLRPSPSLAFSDEGELFAIERRLLAEERRRGAEAAARVRRGETVFADTGFLGPLTYTAGLVAREGVSPELFGRIRLLARRSGRTRIALPDLVVYLDVRSRTARARVASDPLRHPAPLAGRHERVGRFERAFYVTTFRAAFPERFRRLSAEPSVEEIVRRLGALLATRPSPRGPLRSGARSLDRLLEGLVRRRPPRRRNGPAASLKKVARSGRDPLP